MTVDRGRLLVGVALATVGVVLVLGQADVLDAGDVLSEWWPLGLVGAAVAQIGLERRLRPGTLLVLAGSSALLGVTTGLLSGTGWRYIWPALLILLGGWIALGRPRLDPGDDPAGQPATFVLLGTRKLASRADPLRGGTATVLAGGTTLDLTEAVPGASGAVLRCTVVLGSLNVIVPEGWRVEVRALPLFGGWDDTTRRDVIPAGAPRLTVNALILFGGLDVRHRQRWL